MPGGQDQLTTDLLNAFRDGDADQVHRTIEAMSRVADYMDHYRVRSARFRENPRRVPDFRNDPLSVPLPAQHDGPVPG